MAPGGQLLNFAINHMTFPGASFHRLVELAVMNSCIGVEVRNDLAGEIFTGLKPEHARSLADSNGIRILALAQLNEFNRISSDKLNEAQRLIDTAVACGAESICLIPQNDGNDCEPSVRKRHLTEALTELHPLLKEANIIGMVEPLGFETSSIKSKSEVVETINTIDGGDHIQLVHDTFHHFLAGNSELFPEHTGMVHISGVADSSVATKYMMDSHRGFVDGDDQLNNIAQLSGFIAAGYTGPVSMEVFSPEVHASHESPERLKKSFSYIASALGAA